jgi:septal ring factor EnvC (AmiA/AmiB activator)
MSALLACTCLACICLASQDIAAQNNEEQGFENLNRERERNAEEITKITNLLETVDKEQKNGLYALSAIRKKIDSRKSELNVIDKQIGSLHRQLKEKDETIKELQARREEITLSYKELINKYYNMQTPKNTWVMYLMASENVMQAYRRMRYVKEILLLLQAQALKIKEMTDQLNIEINGISKKQSLLSSSMSDREKEMQLLHNDERTSATVCSALAKQEAELKKNLREREAAYEMLYQKILDFMRNEMKNSESGVIDQWLNSAKDFEQMRGFLPQPSIGVIVSHFGVAKTKSSYEVTVNKNRGIDILTSEKAEVYAIFKGTVTYVKSVAKGKGITVLVRHGIYSSVYHMLESVFVKEGDEITARQKIGTVKNTKDGNILHFELWQNGAESLALDPEKWLIH